MSRRADIVPSNVNPQSDHSPIDWTTPVGLAVIQPPAGAHPNASNPPVSSNDHRPSTVSFAARNHIRHHRHNPARGTWRTRMKRTKCWRCELEARRNASAEAMHKLFNRRSWEHKWHATKAKLRWSCFCRYKGYDDEEDEEEESHREVQERARLGRFGRSLH